MIKPLYTQTNSVKIYRPCCNIELYLEIAEIEVEYTTDIRREYGAVSLGNWCQTVRDNLGASSSRVETYIISSSVVDS